MRSWSKWVSFSRSRKSCSSVGPRRPAFSELWLSGSTTPWLVVSRFSGPCVKASSCFWRAATASPALDLREPSVREEAIDHSCVLVPGEAVGARAAPCGGSAAVEVEDDFERPGEGGDGQQPHAAGSDPGQPGG